MARASAASLGAMPSAFASALTAKRRGALGSVGGGSGSTSRVASRRASLPCGAATPAALSFPVTRGAASGPFAAPSKTRVAISTVPARVTLPVGRHGARSRRHVEHLVLGQRALHGERRCRGGELEPLQLDRAGIAQGDVAAELRRAGEDRPDDGGQQAFDARSEVEGEAPVRSLAHEARAAVGADIRPRLEGEGRAPIVEDALTGEVEPDRRQPGQSGEAGDEAAGRLVERRTCRSSRSPCGTKASLAEKRPAASRRRASSVRSSPSDGGAELRRAACREPRCRADHRLAERQFRERERLDLDLHRQFRQERLVRCRRGFLAGHRAAQDLEACRFRADRLRGGARTERGPPPDQPRPVEPQPDAVAVG